MPTPHETITRAWLSTLDLADPALSEGDDYARVILSGERGSVS